MIVVQDASHSTAKIKHHCTTFTRQRRYLQQLINPVAIDTKLRFLSLLRFQDFSLQSPQSSDICTHFLLRRAVHGQDRLGQIATEMIHAESVRNVREPVRNARHTGVLSVRHPQHHIQSQGGQAQLSRSPIEFPELETWDQPVHRADFTVEGAVYRLDFRRFDAERDTAVVPVGLFSARLSVPSVGTFAATENVTLLRPYSLIRDVHQMHNGTRRLPDKFHD